VPVAHPAIPRRGGGPGRLVSLSPRRRPAQPAHPGPPLDAGVRGWEGDADLPGLRRCRAHRLVRQPAAPVAGTARARPPLQQPTWEPQLPVPQRRRGAQPPGHP